MRANTQWLILVLALVLGVACSAPTTPGKSDTCTGPQCGADAVDMAGDVVVDSLEQDGTGEVVDMDMDVGPDTGEDISCDQCEEGQIKCDGPNRYRECKLVSGCWTWSSKVSCSPSTFECVCAGEDEGICEPTDGEPCVCLPQCDGLDCGPDGCGGECGACGNGEFCIFGKCEAGCQSNCNPGETICNGPLVQECEDINAGTGRAPCYIMGDSKPCPANSICEFDECTCTILGCGDNCCASDKEVCFQENCCLPNCEAQQNECGSDGCGGTCGSCPQDKPFCISGTCMGECPGNSCNLGEQKCDGTFGFLKCVNVAVNCNQWSDIATACPFGQQCDPISNTCKCAPQCTGKSCGPDGCGGDCGTCEYPQTCTTEGTCICDCSDKPVKPVCDLATNTTYDNSCEALCGGADVATLIQGACPNCFDLCTEEELEPFQFCGFDYVTYDNFCQLKCEIGGPQCTSLMSCPQVLYPGACMPNVCTGCPTQADPVCGTDGETYFNKCDLQLCAPQGTNIHCEGECVSPTLCPACTAECDPVCGAIVSGGGNTILKTFSNSCGMQCAGATMAEEGPCCPNCPTAEQWVCTSAFTAYKNSCTALCKAPEEAPVLYSIPLGSDGKPKLAVCEDCQCDLAEAAYAPVCGNDYQSYFNECDITCSGAEVRCQGECNFDDCPCPQEPGGLAIESETSTPPNAADTLQRGVCGADGKTYGNACSAAYYGTYVAQPTWCPSCSAECAGLGYQPVCCEDGVTYANLCIPQKCNSFLDPSKCQKGRCCTTDEQCDDGNAATVDACNTTAGVCENI